MSLFTTKNISVAVLAIALTACGEVSQVQKQSPANAFKDYEKVTTAVIGVGDPISKRQMKANATIKMDGSFTLENVIRKVAGTYNVAVRWDNGVRKHTRRKVLVSDLTFDEVRSYLEDVYEIQIVREGERRLLILPSADEPRIKEFAPGINVRLSQAIRGLAKECGMNLVISENKKILAETLVTTSLRDVTCRDAMSSLLVPHGLSLVDAGDYFTIGGYPTREWTLDLYEMALNETKKISYKSEFSGGGEENASDSGGSVDIEVTNERDIWKELEDNLSALVEKSCDETQAQNENTTSLLAPPPGGGGFVVEGSSGGQAAPSAKGGSFVCGYVRVNKSVGIVQMRAPVPVLEQADEIIQRVQDIASRRLLIEARVIAVTKARGFQQGADFSVGAGFDNNRKTGVIGNANSLDETLATTALGDTTNSIAAKLVDLIASNGGGFISAQTSSLDLVANMAEQFGTTYQLMSPTMEVMDRQRAVLVDGRNEKYFVLETNVESSTNGVTTTTTAEERTQFVGLQFSVAAQVADGDKPHTVDIQVPMLEISRYVTVPDGSGSQVPVVTSRIIDQKVRVHDGEIKVIGGLNRTIAVDRESGVPLLRGIPVAGKLFNDEDISYEDVEFIVLLQARRVY